MLSVTKYIIPFSSECAGTSKATFQSITLKREGERGATLFSFPAGMTYN